MVQLGSTVPTKIRESTRFNPYFKIWQKREGAKKNSSSTRPLSSRLSLNQHDTTTELYDNGMQETQHANIQATATRGMSQNRAPHTTTHSSTPSSDQLDVTQPSHDSEIHETQQTSIKNQPLSVEGTENVESWSDAQHEDQ
ncbi:hypothetical protein C1H46_042434 [Malus baccata]|uniref:Uncharacterized protein n=1 Tax=Malus baccata TaxID=106549 RepID=A0A540KCT2_MALBA|nr:hypothetical protein C1H46_042434 [Malus baccata]